MSPDLRHEIEAAHIVADMLFLRRLFQGILDNEEHAGIVSLCAINYICLLTHEAARHISKLPSGLMSAPELPKSPAIAQSRHSAKLFDDKERGLAGVTGIIEGEIIPAHSKEFLGNTWLRFARPLESDLGLFSYRGRLIATTHSIQYNLGLSVADTRISDLGPAIRDVATECSRFADAIARDHAWQGSSFLNYVELRKIRSHDTRAATMYRTRFDPALSVGLTASLLSFQASLNFLDEMLSTDPEPASRGTIAKLKYITLRHTYTSLRAIRADSATSLHRHSIELLERALAPPTDTEMLAGSDNRLRNILVHYGIGKIPLESTSLTSPLFGLIETLTPNYTFDSFDQAVSREVGRLSSVLNTWSKP